MFDFLTNWIFWVIAAFILFNLLFLGICLGTGEPQLRRRVPILLVLSVLMVLYLGMRLGPGAAGAALLAGLTGFALTYTQSENLFEKTEEADTEEAKGEPAP
jgi:hypothetical protein